MACRDFEMKISEHYKSQLRRPSYRNSVKCFRISMLLVFLYMALSVHCSDFSCRYLAMVAHFQFSINQHCLCLDSYEFDLCKLLKFCISSHLKSGR